ncbi:MAG: biopolymer transporter ExbD [Akkermansiaceae bacterium]
MASDKLRAVNKEQGEDAAMDMSPMIDMVFLLLLFFLVVSNPKTIKIDPRLEPPVALNAQATKSIHGKIVVNIHNNGDFFAEDMTTRFDTKEDMTEYITKEKDKIKAIGNTPVIHIRADKGVDFTYCRQVIRSAADAGVDVVAYGAYNK